MEHKNGKREDPRNDSPYFVGKTCDILLHEAAVYEATEGFTKVSPESIDIAVHKFFCEFKDLVRRKESTVDGIMDMVFARWGVHNSGPYKSKLESDLMLVPLPPTIKK